VIPLALFMEGKPLLRLLMTAVVEPLLQASSHYSIFAGSSSSTSSSTSFSSSPLFTSSISSGRTLLLQSEESYHQVSSSSSSLTPTDEFSSVLLSTLFIINGCCYFLYNQTSFIVLGKVSFITHATLNVMRRVFIIFFTSWYFAVEISPLNMFGITMAMSGFAISLFFKNKGLASNQHKLSSQPRTPTSV
jgi:hypothetical protein